MTTQTTTVYVQTDEGKYLIQLPDDSRFGFSLYDEDQSWEGGVGIATGWAAVSASSVPAKVRAKLDWILRGG